MNLWPNLIANDTAFSEKPDASLKKLLGRAL